MPKQTAQDAALAAGPTCMHLRSKGMYVTGQRDLDGAIGDGHCWCNKTQHVIGPDDGLVARLSCNNGRACYQAVL